jgi:fibronectin-binding autotransporter adhesin
LQVGPDASPNASITGTVTLTGGTLSGLGTVGGIVNTAGNVMPGGSIGVLHVSGNYTQTAGGALTIEVSPTAASQLKVGGAANLAGALNLIFDPGIYHAASYQIVTAASVNGTFSTVTANDPLGVSHSILYDLASALPQALAAQGASFRGIGGFATVNGNPAAPGFTGTAGGFLTGFDRPVSETAYLGLAAGYLHSSVSATALASGTADTARLAVYGGQFVGPSLFTATAGYAHDWIDTSRILATGTGAENHGANEATVAGQWSLPLQVQGLSQGIATLTPKAGFQFLHLGENTFSDTGAGGFDLSAASHSTDSFQHFVELALAQKFVTADGTLITPEARLGYDREALSGSRTLTVATVSGAQFPVTGIRPSKNIATAGVGLAVQAGPALSLYATYDAILPTGNTTDHTVQAGLRLRF